MRPLAPLLSVVVALAACAHDVPPSPEAPSSPHTTRAPAPTREPADLPPPACNARLRTHATSDAGAVRVEAWLENLTDDTLVVALPDRCPAGPAVFEGIADYDFYGACAMGACPGPREPRTLVVPPRSSAVLATVELAAAGDACRPPLAPGALELSFSVPGAEGLRVCEVTSARVEVPARPAPSPPPPPSVETPSPRRNCPAIACGGCPGGYAPSRDGCPSCECLHGPSVGPAPPSRGPGGVR